MRRSSLTGMTIILLLILPLTVFQAIAAEKAAMPSIHKHTQEILKRPLFQHWKLRHEKMKQSASTGFSESLRETLEHWRNNETLKNILQDISDWLNDFFSDRDSAHDKGENSFFSLSQALYYFGWFVMLVILIFLAVVIFRSLRQKKCGDVKTARIVRQEQVRDAIETGDALALSDEEWLRETQRLAADGEYRLMYRSLYLALLSGLHQRGRIKFHRYRTNWHYVNNYQGSISHKEEFSSLTSMFDRIWYGHKDGQEYPLERVRMQVRNLLHDRGAIHEAIC